MGFLTTRAGIGTTLELKPKLLFQNRVIPVAYQLGPRIFGLLDVSEWTHLDVEQLI